MSHRVKRDEAITKYDNLQKSRENEKKGTSSKEPRWKRRQREKQSEKRSWAKMIRKRGGFNKADDGDTDDTDL